MIELLLEAERALSYGLVERAEQLYRQVATSDPKNSIAVVGLARVALERADDLGAYLLARRALAIDPENEAARRLAVRLEEVLATRGEPVTDPMPPDLAEPREGGRAAANGAAMTPADADAGPAGDVDTDASAYEPPRARAEPPARSGRRSFLDRIRRR